MFGISLARISLLTGSSLGGGVGVSATLDLNFRGQGYSAAMAGYTFNQLIDFTRTSSATYIDATGKIVPTAASRNLLTFTQEFDNAAWTKVAATVTANAATAPDGTLTADTLIATAGASTHNVSQAVSTSGSPVTFSIYAKAGTHSFIQLMHTNVNSVNFNLSTGTVGTVPSGMTASMTAVGNGFYRCTVSMTPPSAASIRVAMVSSISAAFNESWTAAGTETVFLWGAQLEAGSTLTDYTRNVGGVYPPRFDYDPVTRAPKGLLIEEQRTNLLTYSEQFDNAVWSKNDSTVSANAILAPDGTVSADKLIETATNVPHNVLQTASLVSGTTYTISVYAKIGERSEVSFYEATSTGARARFNLSTGNVISVAGGGTPSAKMESAGNGFYRCSMTFTAGVTGATNLLIYIGDVVAYLGDGTSGIYLWGAQLEAGSFATSYIPTVASQVTRSGDFAAITGANFSQWYNQSEGTFLAEVTASNVYGISALGLDSGTGSVYRSASGSVEWWNGSTVMETANIADWRTPVKIAAAFDASNRYLCLNGGTVATSASSLSNGGKLELGRAYNVTAPLNGHIRSVRFYPTRLSNAQLQALTA